MAMVKGDDMDMDGGAGSSSKASGAQKKSKQTLSDFGAMGDLLSKIENKMEKQANHEQRQAAGKKVKESAVDRDKDRLNKIAGLSVFQENTLDNLFLHVTNSVASKQGGRSK